MLPIRRTRTNQPSGDGIDWGNPLTKGLELVWHPKALKYFYGTGSPSYTPTQTGVAEIANGTSTSYVAERKLKAFPITFLRYGSTSIEAYSGVGPAFNSGSDARFMFRSQSGNNTFHIRTANGSGWLSRDFSVNSTNRSSVQSVQVGVCKNESTLDVYWNGILDNGALGGGSSASPDYYENIAASAQGLELDDL